MRTIFDDAMRRRTFGNHMWIERERERAVQPEHIISQNNRIRWVHLTRCGVVCDNGVREQIKRYCFFLLLFIYSKWNNRKKPTKTDLRSEAKKRKEYICWSCRKRFWFVSFTPAECELASVCVCVCVRRAWQISWSTVRAKPQHSFDYVVFVSFRLH